MRSSRGQIAALLAVSLAGVYGQSLMREAEAHVVDLTGGALQAFAWALIAFGFGLSFVRYASFGRFLTILTKSCALGLAAYLVVEPTDLVVTFADAAWRAEILDRFYWPALACAALGWYRPSFILFAATYVMAVRHLTETISGYSGTTLDIRYLVEMAQYLSLWAVILNLTDRLVGAQREGVFLHVRTALFDHRRLEICIGFNAIAFHFGNYFWSGVAKLAAGPTVLSWIMENETETNVLLALEKGVFIFGSWPVLTNVLYHAFAELRPVTNAFVLLTQLLAVVAVLRRQWIVGASLAYDALHIGLYLIAGLFFWPWIWINVGVLLAVRSFGTEAIPAVARASCILVITLGGILGWIGFARLGWYESRAIRSPFFEVQAPDGAWLRVPVAYFGGLSYIVSHGKMDQSRQSGHYSASNWGAVSYDEFKRVQGCRAPTSFRVSSPETQVERAAREERVTKFIQAQHRKVLARVDGAGRHDCYLRAHHHPSNPLLYPEFNRLDLRRVMTYRLVTQSVCLSLRAGVLERKVFNQYVTDIHVGK